MNKTNVLDIWFAVDGDTKLYKVRIRDPANVDPKQATQAIHDIVKSGVFDFDDAGSPYHVVKAHYTGRNKQVLIKN